MMLIPNTHVHTHMYMCIYIVYTHTQDTLHPPTLTPHSLSPSSLLSHGTCMWYVVRDDMSVCSLMPTDGSSCALKEGRDGR